MEENERKSIRKIKHNVFSFDFDACANTNNAPPPFANHNNNKLKLKLRSHFNEQPFLHFDSVQLKLFEVKLYAIHCTLSTHIECDMGHVFFFLLFVT